ncbi:hypothetical protein DD630_19640 [Streptomyces sp. BSE7F]|nr:hypothetical protein DD630_19640 [Streptomyces sp. BSE7F]
MILLPLCIGENLVGILLEALELISPFFQMDVNSFVATGNFTKMFLEYFRFFAQFTCVLSFQFVVIFDFA